MNKLLNDYFIYDIFEYFKTDEYINELKLTKFKEENIFTIPITFRSAFLFVSVISIIKINRSSIPKKLFYGSISFLFLSTLITPELINPFYKSYNFRKSKLKF